MRFEQLEQIIEIEKQKSISKAAQNLYMTQPTLSLSLSSLETEIGAPLFYRSSSGVTPTPVGEKVLQLSRQMLDCRQQILDCGSRQHMPTGKVPVLITPAFNSLYSDIITLFHQRYPGLIIDLQVRTFREIINELSSGQATIGITMWGLDDTQTVSTFKNNHIHYEAFHTYPIMIYTSADDPLLQYDRITEAQINTRQIAVYSYDYYKYDKKNYLSEKNKPLLVTDYHVMQHILATNQAVALLPATFSIKNEYVQQARINARPYEDYTTTSYLLYTEERPLTFTEECTVSLLRELLQAYQ